MAKPKSPAKVNPRQPVLVNAAKLITRRVDEMLAYESCLADPDNVYELHEMRIAGKRLRYTMEVFQPVYSRYTDAGPEFGAMLQAVKNLQEHLGILHDADVLVPQILEHLGRVVKQGYGLPPADTPESADGQKGKPKGATHKDSSRKSNKSGKPPEVLPIVGVHQVNYAGCEGLLTLCRQIRADRDAQYAKLTQEWQQIRAEQVFERLRDLLARNEGTGSRQGDREIGRQGDREKEGEKTKSKVENRKSAMDSFLLPPPSSLSVPSSLPDEEPDAANRQTPQVQRAPGEPGHVAAARRRVPPRAPEKDGEPEQQGRKGRQRRDASVPARTASSTPPAARNGNTRPPRHPRAGADSDSGAGKGGAE